MAGTNEFVPFGTGPGANVLTAAGWAALGARLSGFAGGVASSAQCNTAWRQSTSVAAMVAAMVADRDERGLPRGVRLRLDTRPAEPLPVPGEGARLERVFANLIDNAVSFSPDGALVTIAVRREGEMLAVGAPLITIETLYDAKAHYAR